MPTSPRARPRDRRYSWCDESKGAACAIRPRRRFPVQVQSQMSKQSMREEAERMIREAMEKKTVVVKQGNTRIEAVCGKCGAPNRVQAARGETRVKFACKNCGHRQETL